MTLEIIYTFVLSLIAVSTSLGVPGPLLIAIGALIYGIQTGFATLTVAKVIIFLILGIFGVAIDNILSLIGAKRFGASKWSVVAAFLGFFTVFILGPLGIVAGPALGAFLSEVIIYKKRGDEAVRAAFGAVVGLLTGMVVKLIVGIGMVVWFASIVF